MSHNIRTAERHCHVKDDIRWKDRVGRYLEESTKDTNEPSTSREHAPASSSSSNEDLIERFSKRKSAVSETLADRYGKRKKKNDIPRRALTETSSSSDDEAPAPPSTRRPTTSRPAARKGQRLFTSRETEIIRKATERLKNSATKKQIVSKLKGDEEAVAYDLVPGDRFSEQQLRDKFKAIRRNK